MTDARFFEAAGPFTLSELAEIAGARLEGGGAADLDRRFVGVASLEAATADTVSFLDNRAYVDRFAGSAAGACLVHPDHVDRAPADMALLVTETPYHGYARVARAFHPLPPVVGFVHPASVIDETAVLGPDCRVEAGAVVGSGAEIGARCRIGANAVIGSGVVIGDDTVVGPGASLECCLVGARVILHAGARIGQDGFGFALGPEGHLKVPQLGRVLIEDDVEVGANTTIDRGAGPDTVIGAGTKIDNLVQIAHNVQLGRNCVVVSQVGVSGSTTVGDFAMIGGQAGLAGHLEVGSGARIAAQAGVMRDVAPGATVIGAPAMPARQFWRQVAAVAALAGKKKGRD